MKAGLNRTTASSNRRCTGWLLLYTNWYTVLGLWVYAWKIPHGQCFVISVSYGGNNWGPARAHCVTNGRSCKLLAPNSAKYNTTLIISSIAFCPGLSIMFVWELLSEMLKSCFSRVEPNIIIYSLFHHKKFVGIFSSAIYSMFHRSILNVAPITEYLQLSIQLNVLLSLQPYFSEIFEKPENDKVWSSLL